MEDGDDDDGGEGGDGGDDEGREGRVPPHAGGTAAAGALRRVATHDNAVRRCPETAERAEVLVVGVESEEPQLTMNRRI